MLPAINLRDSHFGDENLASVGVVACHSALTFVRN